VRGTRARQVRSTPREQSSSHHDRRRIPRARAGGAVDVAADHTAGARCRHQPAAGNADCAPHIRPGRACAGLSPIRRFVQPAFAARTGRGAGRAAAANSGGTTRAAGRRLLPICGCGSGARLRARLWLGGTARCAGPRGMPQVGRNATRRRLPCLFARRR